ncbi:MAG: hypothetical protein ABI348_00800 [Nitrososphaera sp.]|jgi:hypothetical protein
MVKLRIYAIGLLLTAGILLSATTWTNVSLLTPAFAQTAPQPVGEHLIANTNSTVYQYGQTIRLTIEDNNTGPRKDISTTKDTYAGVVGPCGVDYLDFAMLKGDYTETITTYDQLAALRNDALNVVYANPYDQFMCPMGYSMQIQHATIKSDSHNATISFVTPKGESISRERNLISVIDIQNLYGKTTLHKQVAPGQILDSVDSQVLPVGKYTIVAFSLSGEISKPLLIEVVSPSSTPAAVSVNSSGTGISANASFPSVETGAAIASSIGAFGAFMAVSFKKSGSVFRGGPLAVVMIVLVVGMFLPSMSTKDAFATYNVSSQGVEAHGTASTFTQATVEDRFEGVRTDLGDNNGLSVQNNHFLSHFTVGNNYLWSQSFVQQQIPTTATFNNHACTTQAGSFTCSLPSQVQLRGVYNFWTHANIFGFCPSGFTAMSGECANINAGTWNTVNLSTSNTRLDLNTYQEIQSPGNVYLDQKYRTCTGSFSCTGYTTLYSYTSPQYGNVGNFYYDIGTFNGNSRYGVEGPEGQCGGCNGGTSRVNFGAGTYETQTYSITNPGGVPSPAYRASGITDTPAEQNANLCWWNSITNSGGSSPTFTTTAQYNTACSS